MSAARKELVELAERDGHLTPASVVDAATNPTSALHPHFTWDDTEAAEQHRLTEARQLIRRYKVTIIGGEEGTVSARLFTSVPLSEDENSDRGYVQTVGALSNTRTHDMVVQQALRDVARLRRKYRVLTDFDAVLQASIRRDEEGEATG